MSIVNSLGNKTLYEKLKYVKVLSSESSEGIILEVKVEDEDDNKTYALKIHKEHYKNNRDKFARFKNKGTLMKNIVNYVVLEKIVSDNEFRLYKSDNYQQFGIPLHTDYKQIPDKKFVLMEMVIDLENYFNVEFTKPYKTEDWDYRIKDGCSNLDEMQEKINKFRAEGIKQFVHNFGIMSKIGRHRDLKFDNLFVNNGGDTNVNSTNPKFVIGDFGHFTFNEKKHTRHKLSEIRRSRFEEAKHRSGKQNPKIKKCYKLQTWGDRNMLTNACRTELKGTTREEKDLGKILEKFANRLDELYGCKTSGTSTTNQRSSRRHYHRVALRTKTRTKPRPPVRRKVHRTKTGARYVVRVSKVTGKRYKQYLPRAKPRTR